MLKYKRLTEEKSNGTITLSKKHIDLDMFSPVIAKVLSESIEQLAMFEKKIINDELLEIPFPLNTKLNLFLDNKQIIIKVIGYKFLEKDMFVTLETLNDGIVITMSIKEALIKLKKIGSGIA